MWVYTSKASRQLLLCSFCIVVAVVVAELRTKWNAVPSSGSVSSSSICGAAAGSGWDAVDRVLEQQLKDKTFPGCVAAVFGKNGSLYLCSYGNFTYGQPAPFSGYNPNMSNTTLFDVASLTKVLASTTAAMYLYQRGHLDIDRKVAEFIPGFGQSGKQDITVRNLLLHNSGFPPDPDPGYYSRAVGCPETSKPRPQEEYSCQEKLYLALLNQTIDSPPGYKFVYSDLSMITLMHVIGAQARDFNYVKEKDLNLSCIHGNADRASAVPHSYMYYTQCYYEAFVRLYVLEHLGMSSSGFRVPESKWGLAAPTWEDDSYRHILMQGVVSDSNSYAMGGVSGHAGLFTTVGDITLLLYRLVFAQEDDPWINSTTVHTFTTVQNLTQSSRALGWDTNAKNYTQLCGNFSAKTFTHTGYTGTQVCCDPEVQVCTVLLTNRCYPDDSPSTKHMILVARELFNSAVKSVIG